MKTTIFLLLFCSIQMYSNTIHGQNTNLTINKVNISIEEFIDQVESQSEYRFLYNKQLINLNGKLTIKVDNEKIEDVLNDTFAETDISYIIRNKQVVLSPRTAIEKSVSDKKKIKGVILDEKGEPVIGATVVVKNSPQQGAITDVDGNFSLDGLESDIFEISSIGYIGQLIQVGNQTDLRIILQEDIKQLDEIIVIGYGTTSARRTVSAVGTLKTDKIDELPYTSIAASLQGRVAGVIVQQSGGEPGGNPPRISIRGGGTPLYVIDGIIRDAGDFNSLTSSDIESLNILKDASATAVYGAQAGNGIVLVTTKKGAEGKLSIDYTAGLDFSKPTTVAERVNAVEYVLAANDAARYDGQGEYSLYAKDQVDAIRNGTSSIYGNIDWYDQAVRNLAPQQRHTLTISGKSKNGIQHFTSLGLLDQNSIYKASHNNQYKRYNVRSNVSTTFDEYGLEVGVNLDGTYAKRTPNPYGQEDIWRNLMGYNKAIDKIYNDDGTYTALDAHPIVYLDKASGYVNQYNNTINAQAYINWDVLWVKGLSAKLTGNTNYASYDRKRFKSRAPQYSDGILAGADKPKELEMNRSWTRGNTLEFGVNYKKTIDKHFVEAQAVYSYYDSYSEWFNANRTGFISNDFDQLSSGDASTKDNDGGASERSRIGYVGRLRYGFGDKYFLEGNFRYDGSDNFTEKKRWGFFPSGAAAWVISEESFVKPLLNKKIINFAKARVSYGQVGLEDGVKRFGYVPIYSYNSQSAVVGGKYVAGFSEGDLVSPEALSWYTKDVFDIGLDFAFLNNNLSVSFDYYYYKTKGYLMSPSNRYTTTLGKALPQIKSNSIHRRAGYEASVRYKNKYKDFNYDIGFQFTTYNELWEVKEDESLTDLMDPRKRLTHRKNVYGSSFYENTGIYQDMTSIIDAPRRLSSTELKAGDLGYKDINGDGKIDSDDQIKLGKPFFPSFDYGIDFNLDYKGFFLYGLFQGTGKRYTELTLLLKGGNIVNSNYAYQMNSWTPDNTSAEFPRSSALQSTNSGNNTLNSDFWLVDASYFRLKSLQLGYDFKKTIFNKSSKISKFKVSLMGTNIFTVSDAMDYFDPESYNYGEAYPVQKTYSIVFNIGI